MDDGCFTRLAPCPALIYYFDVMVGKSCLTRWPSGFQTWTSKLKTSPAHFAVQCLLLMPLTTDMEYG
ncbi:Hypothetical predicted protein [Cloeon dipterum]|uniref:Uncharacterized protein n=1 Tax=Cloeon dipterum TaxID=197152 RepID=A0A8S1D3L7_9INSE|nr:Hypothetical predicted protein [Cloeon dipterum]